MDREPGTERNSTAGAALLLLWLGSVVLWWGFAFVPGDPPPDSWIAAARAACFGSSPGGPPAAYGWMLLALAPLMLLGFMFVVFRTELRSGLRLIAEATPWRLAALVLTLGFVAVLGWAAIQVSQAVRVAGVSYEPAAMGALPENYPRQNRALPAFSLVDQGGAEFDDTMLRGTPTVFSFVFAHCQTVCPVVGRNTAAAVEQIGTNRARLVLVTLDPWRDTPATLAALAESWGLPEEARLLSGEPEAVERLLDALDVARDRSETDGDIVHPPLVYVIDGDGQVAYLFNNPPVDWIVEGVRRVTTPS